MMMGLAPVLAYGKDAGDNEGCREGGGGHGRTGLRRRQAGGKERAWLLRAKVQNSKQELSLPTASSNSAWSLTSGNL